jgi:hypothetical protein
MAQCSENKKLRHREMGTIDRIHAMARDPFDPMVHCSNAPAIKKTGDGKAGAMEQ